MKEKTNYLSLLSVISALAVVILHTNGCFWKYSSERYWFTANIIECVMYFAVPVFFMISGATLIEYRKRYSTKEFFQKRIRKTLIPFLCFSIIGLFYQLYMGYIQVSDLNFWTVIDGILNVKYNETYWFFISLFSVYLCIPILAGISDEIRQTTFKYLAIVCFLFNTVLPYIFFYLPVQYPGGLTVRIGSSYLFYIIVGYLLHTNDFTKKQRIIIYFLGILGLFTHMYGTYHLSTAAGTIIKTYKGYTNLPTVLYSVAVFVLAKNLSLPKWLYKAVNFLAPYTFSIYLLHWYFIDYAETTLLVNEYSILWRLCGFLPIALICIGITALIRKIPFGSKVLP